MLLFKKTTLNLEELKDEVKEETKYNHHLPFYLKALFPLHGTTKLGTSSNNELYTPRVLTAYAIR